jgi:hypothetical protein
LTEEAARGGGGKERLVREQQHHVQALWNKDALFCRFAMKGVPLSAIVRSGERWGGGAPALADRGVVLYK